MEPRSAAGKRRVLFVNTAQRPPLGADTWIHVQIMRHLDRATHEVHVACAPGPAGSPTPTWSAVAAVADVHVRPTNLGPELGGLSYGGKVRALLATVPAVVDIIRLAWYARRLRVPIIHTSDRPRDAIVSVVMARLVGAKSIVHVHVAYNPGWIRGMLRWSLHHADALIAVSEFVAQSLIDGGHRPDRVHVVLNAIDVTRWVPGRGRDAVRTEFGFDPSTPVITTVCRLFPEKGPADLIRAMNVLRRDVPDVTLLLVGQALDAQYMESLTRLVHELDLGEHVKFLGRREDVAAVMAASEVYAMPSYEEPFGLVFLEAMAMRLPVVGLANGGTLEVVDHGKSGLLSDHGDTAALVENLRTLLRDGSLREQMGASGRERVESRFQVTRMADDVARVYSQIASGTGAVDNGIEGR